jgi:preprotein translocase subunit YajC
MKNLDDLIIAVLFIAFVVVMIFLPTQARKDECREQAQATTLHVPKE